MSTTEELLKDTPIDQLAKCEPSGNPGPCPCQNVHVENHDDGTASCVSECPAANWEDILAANPVLKDPEFQEGVAKWNQLQAIADKLGLSWQDAADFIAYGMTEGKEGRLPEVNLPDLHDRMSKSVLWSKLTGEQRERWEDLARKEIYPDLTPYSEEKEAQIRPLARKMFYQAHEAKAQ